MRRKLAVLAGLLAMAALGAAASASAAEKEGLVSLLTSQLGVTNQQAAGGAGSILGYAKGNMKADDFKKVAAAVPETKDLIKAAPKAEGPASMLGGLGSQTGGVGATAALAGSFEKLGLKSDMIGKFIPIVVSYTKSKGGAGVGDLLSSALGLGGQ